MPQANYRPADCLKFNQYFYLFIYLSTAMLIFLITRCRDCLCTKFPSVKNDMFNGSCQFMDSPSPRGLPANKISRFVLSLNLSPCPFLTSLWSEALSSHERMPSHTELELETENLFRQAAQLCPKINVSALLEFPHIVI